jgi:hypothetical protein
MTCASVYVYAATLVGLRCRDLWCAGITTSEDIVTQQGAFGKLDCVQMG